MREKVPDHYEVLGVARDADLATIRAAYRRLAKRFHPDLTEGMAPEEHARADSRMREVNAAYHALTRDRAGYDEQLGRQERASGVRDEGSPVARGRRPAEPRRGDDDVLAITLDAREIREGVTFTSGIDGEPLLLPPGVEPGRHHLPGRGHFGSYGGPRGDLWIDVHVLPFAEPTRASRRHRRRSAGGPVMRTIRVALVVALGLAAFLGMFLLWQRFVAG